MSVTQILSLAAVLSLGLAGANPGAFAAAPGPVAADGPARPAATPAAVVVTGAPRQMIPVHEGRDPDPIADSDTVITQVIPLDYVSASDMLALLSELVKPDTPMVASNNYLVVTEASCVVKRIVQIICYVDVRPQSNNVIVVIPLASGNAAEAARQINAVFNSQNR
jgi:type II secretory pathway component GspD/PulD (secretin)